jgi:cobalt/nickel transport system permease protein
MSRGWTGGHLPDPDLITWYGEHGTSLLSSCSPWTKMVLLAATVVFLTVISHPLPLAALYLLVLAGYLGAGLPGRQLAAWSLLPFLAVISLAFPLMWGEPGTPLLAIPLPGFPVVLTDRGLALGMALTLRALTSFTASLVFLMTTRYAHLAAVISRILPSPADQILLLAYRFLFTTLAMLRAMLRSLRSRGGELLSGVQVQAGMLAAAFALTMIRSYDRAERVGRAMESRGYRPGSLVSAAAPGPRPREGALLFAWLALGIFLAAWPWGGGP